MKNTILILSLFISFISSASAENLEAKPFAALVAQLESNRFTYRGSGLAYGFNSIHSCVYTSAEVVVLKNYCVPDKDYPARGFTIYSPKFGIIELYQERIPNVVVKHDIQITVFPEALQGYMKDAPSSYRLSALNDISEHFTHLRGPSCWATNYSRYTEAPQIQCNVDVTTIDGHPEWSVEVDRLTMSNTDWNRLFRKLERLFPR